MAKTAAKKAVPARTPSRAPTPSKGPSKEVAVSSGDIDDLMERDSGVGVSTLASDNVIPLIYLLQALSPQCVKQSPSFVSPGVNGNKGAEAGNIWFRGSKDLIDGEEEGMKVTLCHFRVVWIEWGPERGDGLRGRHDERPTAAKLVEDPKNPKKKKWVMPDGNIVVETREHAVIVHDFYDAPSPFVIAMSGSNHQPAKQWMTDIGRKRTAKGNRAPLWGYLWRMKTVPKTDGENNWFSWSIEDEDEKLQDVAIYNMAKQLHDDFEAGAKRSDEAGDDPDATARGADISGGDDDSI